MFQGHLEHKNFKSTRYFSMNGNTVCIDNLNSSTHIPVRKKIHVTDKFAFQKYQYILLFLHKPWLHHHFLISPVFWPEQMVEIGRNRSQRKRYYSFANISNSQRLMFLTIFNNISLGHITFLKISGY